MFHRITAVVLFVQDFQKCLTFYRDILGLHVAQLEPRFAAFKMQDQDFALVEMSEASEMVNVAPGDFEPQSGKTDRVLLCTRVENVDVAYEQLSAKGVEFTLPPPTNTGGCAPRFLRTRRVISGKLRIRLPPPECPILTPNSRPGRRLFSFSQRTSLHFRCHAYPIPFSKISKTAYCNSTKVLLY